jgi:serine/threonine protein kinase
MVTEPQITEVRESPVPEPGSVFAEKYKVDRLLGRGSLGVVFLARHIYTNRRVAIKLLNSDLTTYSGATDRLLREAQITGAIKHENIVDIYDVGIADGKVFLVMEYLQGQSLNAWMKAENRSLLEVLRVLIQAMRGIAAAHAAGVVHRDLKPDNIFVCFEKEGDPTITKVLDFGVSKFIYHGPQMDQANITQSGLMVGTPNYMPPEQIRDPRYVDQRADIYALGIILYEYLAKKIPFSSTTFGDLLIEIMQDGAPSLASYRPDLPKDFLATVDKSTSRERDDRFNNIQEFIGALETYIASLETEVSHVRTVNGVKAAGVALPKSGPENVPGASDSLAEWTLRTRKRSWFGLTLGAATLAVAIFFIIHGLDQPTNPTPGYESGKSALTVQTAPTITEVPKNQSVTYPSAISSSMSPSAPPLMTLPGAQNGTLEAYPKPTIPPVSDSDQRKDEMAKKVKKSSRSPVDARSESIEIVPGSRALDVTQMRKKRRYEAASDRMGTDAAMNEEYKSLGGSAKGAGDRMITKGNATVRVSPDQF